MGKEDLKSMELNDMELENVNGGSKKNEPEPTSKVTLKCPSCKKMSEFYVYMGARAICQNCGYKTMM